MTITSTPGVDAGLDTLSEHIQYLVEEARRRDAMMDSLRELTEDLSPITTQGLNSITLALAEAERRGYIGFTRSGIGVIDKVVTAFSEDDVAALGDNIVLILETIKEMTQPEIMAMTRSTLHGIHDLEVHDEPPSILSLIRQLRDPEMRRGLSRLLLLLKGLGSANPSIDERKETRP